MTDILLIITILLLAYLIYFLKGQRGDRKVEAKKKASIKMFRIENINSIKEIR